MCVPIQFMTGGMRHKVNYLKISAGMNAELLFFHVRRRSKTKQIYLSLYLLIFSSFILFQ